VVTEGPEVIVLAWVVGIVPIADVDDAKVVGGVGTCPVHELRERPDVRLGTEQAGGFGVADMEEVRERIVRTNRVDEIALKTLSDQDRPGHGALSQAAESDPVKRRRSPMRSGTALVSEF
jgi:hypothetical protein